MDMPMEQTDKEYKKRQEAMKKRLAALRTDNPVVKMAIEEQDPEKHQKLHQQFAPVDELVMAARKKFMDDGDFKTCIRNLAEALRRLAGAKGSVEYSKKPDKEEY